MCQITINPTFAGTPTSTGASVTVSGTVTMTLGEPACTNLHVSVLCLQSHMASSGSTAPDAQGNWTITLSVTCTCNDMIEVNVQCVSGAECAAGANGPIVCGSGSTGTGGTGTGSSGSGGTTHCRPKASVLGFPIVIRCQLFLFIMSIGWGTALGMFLFYLGLGPASQNSFGTAVTVIWIVAGGIALIATVVYLIFCRRCLCWFWLLIWRVLWLGGILAAWFRKPICGPNCIITSYIGVGLMILAIIVLFVWQRVCKKTICDAAYEGILYTVAVFFPIVLPLVLWGFPQCTVALGNNFYGPPWGWIVLGLGFVLFWTLLVIGTASQRCSVSFPPPEWDL